jgi:hypothetical protein
MDQDSIPGPLYQSLVPVPKKKTRYCSKKNRKSIKKYEISPKMVKNRKKIKKYT